MPFVNTLHPNRYHGFSVKAPFFEGWYYKLVSADEKHKLAIIPGVYQADDPQQNHSFVQVFISNDNQTGYHRYAYDAFQAARDAFEIRVGPNVFTGESLQLAIDDPDGRVHGALGFSDLTPWPVRWFSPGAMGWFAWVPRMECYHGVVSMDHRIEGQLRINQQVFDFNGGRGYIEKDWGRQFPSAWVWTQSNHFDEPGVSLMLSVAVIPWVGRSFGGFIIGFLHDGVIHRFATYNRSKIETFSVADSAVELVVRNADHRLHVRASRAEGGILQAPTTAAMDRRIIETLDAHLAVRFEDRSGRVIFGGSGRHAGLEAVGDLATLKKMLQTS